MDKAAFLEFDLSSLGSYTIGDAATLNLDMYCHSFLSCTGIAPSVSAVPVPAAVWLFGSGLIGLVGITRRKNKLV